jgi:hypothetical protein
MSPQGTGKEDVRNLIKIYNFELMMSENCKGKKALR